MMSGCTSSRMDAPEAQKICGDKKGLSLSVQVCDSDIYDIMYVTCILYTECNYMTCNDLYCN